MKEYDGRDPDKPFQLVLITRSRMGLGLYGVNSKQSNRVHE